MMNRFEHHNTSNYQLFSDEYLATKISIIMYSYGDVDRPLEESVETVKSLLRIDMNNLLIEAERVAQDLRGSKEISHEDLLFLMRKNKGKLKRLIKYLKLLNDRHGFKSGSVYDISLTKKKTKSDICMEFLESIEDCKEYTSAMENENIFDRSYQNMYERRDSMVSEMSLNEYISFTKDLATKCSIGTISQLGKFKIWLLNDNVVQLPLSDIALIIIHFLCRETILKIVDLALDVKKKKCNVETRVSFSTTSSGDSRCFEEKKTAIKPQEIMFAYSEFQQFPIRDFLMINEGKIKKKLLCVA